MTLKSLTTEPLGNFINSASIAGHLLTYLNLPNVEELYFADSYIGKLAAPKLKVVFGSMHLNVEIS